MTTYAMSMNIPEGQPFTPGKWYEVVRNWDAGGAADVLTDGDMTAFLLWKRCDHLNGGDWLRFDGNEAPPDGWVPGDPMPSWDIYNEDNTGWLYMPKGHRDAILAAQNAGGIIEYREHYHFKWALETKPAKDWGALPRRVRPGSMPKPTETIMPKLDLSNPLSQTFDAMTPEQQAGLRALPKDGTQWKGPNGAWVDVVRPSFQLCYAYRQKPGPITIQHLTAVPGTYIDAAGNKIEVTR